MKEQVVQNRDIERSFYIGAQFEYLDGQGEPTERSSLVDRMS